MGTGVLYLLPPLLLLLPPAITKKQNKKTPFGVCRAASCPLRPLLTPPALNPPLHHPSLFSISPFFYVCLCPFHSSSLFWLCVSSSPSTFFIVSSTRLLFFSSPCPHHTFGLVLYAATRAAHCAPVYTLPLSPAFLLLPLHGLLLHPAIPRLLVLFFFARTFLPPPPSGLACVLASRAVVPFTLFLCSLPTVFSCASCKRLRANVLSLSKETQLHVHRHQGRFVCERCDREAVLAPRPRPGASIRFISSPVFRAQTPKRRCCRE
jgi:hypothetical protein